MSLKLQHFHFSFFSHLIFNNKNKEKLNTQMCLGEAF